MASYKKPKSAVHFYRTLKAAGITFDVAADGAVSISGETGVSPLVVQLVNDRAEQLRPLIIEERKNAPLIKGR